MIDQSLKTMSAILMLISLLTSAEGYAQVNSKREKPSVPGLGTLRTGSTPGQAARSTAHLLPEHAKVLRSWLKGRSVYRPAQVADCDNKSSLKELRADNPRFHPYYAAYDFDKDGVGDFAVVLINTTRKPASQYTLLIFKGDSLGSYKVVKTVAGMDLRQGGILLSVVDRGRTNLGIGEFHTDNCSYLEWKSNKLVLSDCESN